MSTTPGPAIPPSSYSQSQSNGSASTSYYPNPYSKTAPSSSSSSPVTEATSSQQVPSHHQTMLQDYLQQKGRTEEDKGIMKATAMRFTNQLLADQHAVLHPNVDAPFVDHEDVVARLLPYHVFQQPQDDLVSVRQSWKGKEREKAAPEAGDELVEEISETKFALECHRRGASLEKRFRQIQTRAGKRTVPSEQAIFLAQLVSEADRVELNALQSELRQARSELDRIQRAKRAAEAKPAATTSYQTTPTATTAPVQYYQGYSYGYSNAYTSTWRAGVSPYSQVAPSPISTAPSASGSSATPTASTPTSASPASSMYGSISGAIPVQLPVSLLPSLNALGITPVPPPLPGQPAAAAVLQGSNGTMVNLLFDVSLLQSHQMTGLAMILNSLMATGINAHSSSPVDPTTAMRGAASVVSSQQGQAHSPVQQSFYGHGAGGAGTLTGPAVHGHGERKS